jgi:predicted phage tail protein
LPTAEVNLEDNTDGQTDNVIEVKTEADDNDVYLRGREGTSEDNSNELGHELLDYVNEVKTEVDEIEIKEEELKETRHDGADYVSEVKTEADEIDVKEEELSETSHNRADYVSEVKTEPDDIDIEELGNPCPINSVHARKRRRLDIEDSSMDFTDAVNAMKSSLQEDEDSAFFNSLLPSVRSLNTDQKFKFRLKTVQLLQDIRNFFS